MSKYRAYKERASVSELSSGAFGENIIARLTQTIAGDAIYGFVPANFRATTSSGGSAGVSTNFFRCSTGTTLNGYGAIQSLRSVNHRAGMGSLFRFAARWDTPVAGSISGVGAGGIGDEISFGYNGTSFGIWHKYGGKAEVQTLTVTGAASGSENATLTLDDVDLTVPLTAGTVQHNAFEIATYVNANSTTFYAEQNNSTVVISSTTEGNKTGEFSFTSGTATGTFAETTAGVTKTSEHTPMIEFNGTLPGDFDPSKGNSYQIIFQNGYGDIDFFIEDVIAGVFFKCHTIRWSNVNTTPNVTNPSMRSLMYVASETSTSNVVVECPYMTGFVIGEPVNTRNPRGYSNTKSISTTATNILTIRNRRIFNGLTNQSEIEPQEVTFANDGAKSAIFDILANTTLGGSPDFRNVGTNLLSEYDVTGTTTTGGTLLASFVVAKGQTVQVNLKDLRIRMPPTVALTVSGRMASGAAADLSAALSWYEDL